MEKTIKPTILTAGEGMYWYNGETYGKTVIIPVGADASVWQQITETEAQEMIKGYDTYGI